MGTHIILVAALLAIGCVEGAPHVSGKSQYWMNQAGYDTLVIYGSGFSADQFNQFNETKGNKVYLVSNWLSIDCVVVKYLTTTTRITCTNKPPIYIGDSSQYKIEVYSDGVRATGVQHVRFTWWGNPWISYVYPLFGPPGILLRYKGDFKTSVFDKTNVDDPFSTPGSGEYTTMITRVYMGGLECQMYDENDNLYGKFNRYELTCFPQTKFIGAMNSSIYVRRWGIPRLDRAGIYADSKDKLYQHHTYAVVYGVSPNISSSNGGLLINVTGIGFSKDLTQVEVGGAVCEVQEVKYHWLTCTTPHQDLTSAGSGEMGLLYELWEGVHFNNIEDESQWAPLSSSHPNYKSSVITQFQDTVQIPTYSVGKYIGYLHVGHDGLYSLEPFVGSLHYLYLATDGNSSNIRRYDFKEKFTLRKDTPAYVEIRFRSNGNFNLRLLMHDFNSKFIRSQARNAVNEKQRVTLNPKEVYEEHKVIVSRDMGIAKLYLNGFSSPDVNVSDPEQVRIGLMGLTEQQCMVQGGNPKYKYSTSFENDDEPLPSWKGRKINTIVPFCGRNVWNVDSYDPRIYYKDTEGEVDANKYPYLCFALMGDTQDEMTLRFLWNDGKRNRIDNLEFEHQQPYSINSWTYHCYNLIQIVKESALLGNVYKEGMKLNVYGVYVPKPKGPYDDVYVDNFAFVSEHITVIQRQPPALEPSLGILVSDIVVEPKETTENTTSYAIKYITSNCFSGAPLLGIYTSAPDSSWPFSLSNATTQKYDLGGGGMATVARTKVATGPITGTWDLHIQGRLVKDIPPHVTKERLAVMLNSVMGTNDAFTVRERLGCDYSYWIIEWTKDPGRKELVYADISNLAFNGVLQTRIGRDQEGRMTHYPISPDFVTSHRETPTVAVRVNGYTAMCDGECGITYDDTNSLSLDSAAASDDGAGTYTLTITGTGFSSPDTAAYTVKLGERTCAVSSVTAPTEIICSVLLSAGTHVISVAMQPIGLAFNTLTYDVPLTVTAVDPATGGTGGGFEVTISGRGFSETVMMASDDGVTIGGKDCKVVTSSFLELRCIAPAGAPGSADVKVAFGGLTVTSNASFTYDASLSASVTSATPATLSVLGGQITITGTNFGTSTGSVKIGDTGCVVDGWSETSITCTSPPLPPSTYPITVVTSEGSAGGSASITYIFSLTSSSAPKGSTMGGSLLVLRGQGFGSDCSLLQVKLSEGDRCEVKECSDTSLTCQVKLIPKTHLVTNDGYHRLVGVAWQPGSLYIREGDTVVWKWQPSFPASQLTHNVYQTATPTDNDIMARGFFSGEPVASGTFAYTFDHATTVYYASKPIREDLVLRGQVTVVHPLQMAYKIKLTLNGIEASYEPDNTVATVSVSGCESLVTSPLDDCNVTAPAPPDDPTYLYFISQTCLTPCLTGVTASSTENIPGLRGIQVRSGATLTLTGKGFGTATCQNLVTLGGATCSVTAATEDQLTCDLDDLSNLISAKPFPVRVNVLNRGEAQVDIPDYTSAGQVSVVPVVTSLSPKQGSIHGGTRITISGSGLKAANGIAIVDMGSTGCDVESVTASAIVCVTRPHSELSLAMVVVIGQVAAIMDVENTTFTYSLAATPSVTSITPSGSSITITGSNFGSDSSKVSVTLTPVVAHRRRRSLQTHRKRLTYPGDGQEMDEGVEEVFDVGGNGEKLESGGEIDEDIEIDFDVEGDAEKPVEDTQDFDEHTAVKEEEEEWLSEEEVEEIPEEVKAYLKDAGEPESPVRLKRPRIRPIHKNLFGEESDFWGRFTNTEARSFRDTVRLGLWRIGGSGEKVQELRMKVAQRMTRKMLEKANENLRNGRSEKEDSEEEKRIFRDDGVIRAAEDGTISCTPTSVTDTQIECSAPEITSGSYSIRVNIEGSGDSSSTAMTTSPQITDVSPAEGSKHGGAIITITGSAFDPMDVSVEFDTAPCEVLSATTTTITCRTSSHAVGEVAVEVTAGGVLATAPANYTYSDAKTPSLTSVNPASITTGDPLTLSGSDLTPSGADPEVLVDGEACAVSAASATAISCTAPDLMGGEHMVVVRDEVYGDSNTLALTYTFTVTSVTPDTGGFGGVEVTIAGTGFDPAGDSTITVCDTPCTPVLSASSSQIRCIAPPMDANANTSPLACDVIVTNPGGANVTLSSFTYDASLTPFVTSITPKRGGTAGGTTITITGTGFALSGNTVKIGGSECVVGTESETSITCITEAHNGPGHFPVAVTVPAKGIATTDDNGVFFYIDRWSSIYTWGGEAPPSIGQFVVIEKNQTILLDESTDVLKLLLIKGGHVVFDEEASSELVLRAEYILIMSSGSLSIGSEAQPFTGPAVIELYGNHKSIELPHYGAKVLAVREGSLDIHGAHIPITWTHLATTASPGDTTITLKLPVTWKPGDKIVIATTEFRFMKNENEVREIASVSADGMTLTLTEALTYQHISIEQSIGGHTVETRAEVGLLTRNVKIRGNINTDFSGTIEGCEDGWQPGQFATQSCFDGRFGDEEDSDQFGATVMLFGRWKDADLVQGRIEYTEVTEAGQAFQLGRYPLHFHLVGKVNTSYIRGCAVHRTYNRAVTIHAADYLTVERNVVYNNMGHAIFTEDGIERHNVIQYNLAIYTRTSSSLLNVDVTPSSYWVVNPTNIVQHNAAAGGTHFGYWYRLERNPSGPSTTNSYCQNNAPMGTFTNNTAHSFGRYGLWVFSMQGYFPKSGTCGGYNEVAEFHDFTVWHCERGAEIVHGGALQFHNFTTLDNKEAGIELVKMIGGGFGMDDGPGVFNSLVIGYSALSPDGCPSDASGVVAPQQELISIADTKFVNFDNKTCSALSGCSQCRSRQGGYRAQVKGLSFENSPNKIKFKWEYESIWIDTDGSLSGAAENRIVPSMGILPPDDCQEKPEFSINPKVKGSVCQNLKFLRFDVRGKDINPPSLAWKDLIISNEYGNTSVPYEDMRLTHEGWMGILYTKGTFRWQFDNSEQITNISYNAGSYFIDSGEYYYVQHQFQQKPDGFSTTGDDRNSTSGIPDPSVDFHGDFYWDDGTNTLTYMVAQKKRRDRHSRITFDNRTTGVDRNIKLQVYRCKYTDCIPPTVPPVPTGEPVVSHKWSNKETWKLVPVGSGGHPSEDVYDLPKEGDKIIIPAGLWVKVDTQTPSLGRVYVYGILEFADTMDHQFNASIIFIQGGKLIAGRSKSDAFTHQLTITLRGSLDSSDPDNTDMPMPIGTPSVGWKAIGVFGTLQLHGQEPDSTWVKLGATANPGDTQLTLATAVDDTWKDKQVMITTTSKETLETEIRTVTAVSGTTITLDSALSYEHLVVSHALTGLDEAVKLVGEVGLLGRNIVVEGNVYPGFEKKLGGRVLVSTLTQDELEYKGSAQLSGVEFRNMGQLGFDDSDDPRFSLAFHSLGTSVEGDNYVSKCSFNINYNSALGFFDTGSVPIEDNVFYYTVGGSIVDESEGNVYKRNLLSGMLFPGAFNGASEKDNPMWYGAFHITKAKALVLEDNVVAGSQQAGIRTEGEDCTDTTLWTNNEIHGAIFGVMVWSRSGSWTGTCRRLNNFYAWRIESTAFYMQHSASFIVSDVKSVDSKLGVNPLIFAPAALQHKYEAKTATIKDSIFVGASPSHTCTHHQSSSTLHDFFGNSQFWRGAQNGGNAGILFGAFTSGANLAPMFSFSTADTYPALGGGTFIENVTFSSFTTRSCGTDTAMMTNKKADDAVHPIFTSGLTFPDTPQDNRVFIHRANLGMVNPSDCVDMDCDGLKKVVVTDLDGSFLGTAKATLTSQAEHEWDGDRNRGVGDYRIPMPLRQNIDGSAIPESSKFPNKGIVRNSGCENMTAWQGWKCTSLTHRMLIIESMDKDTEIRRLSPIALIADPGPSGYVDLLNGPMDRGWCAGYTCQERISTFYGIVASKFVYEMAMTSTPPEHLRLRLLHADPSEHVILRLYYPKTQQYDVYRGEELVLPTNIDNSKDGYHLHKEDPKYEPKITDASGTNYLQRSQKLLHVVIGGGDEISIKMSPLIILSTGLVIDPDDFYEKDVVANLAALLGVSTANIRSVNIIREDLALRVGRARAGQEEVKVEFEVGSPPTTTLDGTDTASEGPVLTREDLDAGQANMVTFFQTGSVEGVDTDLKLTSLEIKEPPPPPKEPGPKATKEEGTVEEGELFSVKQQKEEEAALNKSLEAVSYDQPSGSTLEQVFTGKTRTYTLLDPYPSVSVQDGNDETVQNLGHASDPWLLTAFLTSGPHRGQLLGTTQVPYKNGRADFKELFVDLPGRYKISFKVSYPTTAPPLYVRMRKKFKAIRKKVDQTVTAPEGPIITNQPFNITLSLFSMKNKATVEMLEPIVLNNQTMKVDLNLIADNGATLDGMTSFTRAGKSMSEIEVTGLCISEAGEGYRIEAVSDVLPAGWEFPRLSGEFSVEPPHTKPANTTLLAKIRARRNNVLDSHKKTYADNMLKMLKDMSLNVTWGPIEIIHQKKLAVIPVRGTHGTIEEAITALCAMIVKGKFAPIHFEKRKRTFLVRYLMDTNYKKFKRCTFKKKRGREGGEF